MFSLFLRERASALLSLPHTYSPKFTNTAIHRRSNMGIFIRHYYRYVARFHVHGLPSSPPRPCLAFYTGPYCANLFDPRAWGSTDDETTNVVTLEFTRIVLAIGVFAIGVELPKAYMWKHLRSLFFLLVPVMTWVCYSYFIQLTVFHNQLLRLNCTI